MEDRLGEAEILPVPPSVEVCVDEGPEGAVAAPDGGGASPADAWARDDFAMR